MTISDSVKIYHGDCMEIMPTIQGIDAVIADPPFSARTHSGHDASAVGHVGKGADGFSRKGLGYSAWSDTEVQQICGMLPTSGWVCILTDHTLGRDWEKRLQNVGRYVFAPVPVVVKGRSVRLSGDGPSSWTDWLIVARTKTESKWGTLPGLYEGVRGSIEHMGGKPLNAMCRIVEDYTKPGDTVLDFCMGSGTTAIACIRTGRKFVGIEKDAIHFMTAKLRIERELAQGIFDF